MKFLQISQAADHYFPCPREEMHEEKRTCEDQMKLTRGEMKPSLNEV